MSEPVKVSSTQGVIDAITAAARYAGVLATFTIALLGLVKVRDIAGMIAYIQANGGQALAAFSGLVAIGTAAYGVFKSHKRGDQVATVAAAPEVPNYVATIKE